MKERMDELEKENERLRQRFLSCTQRIVELGECRAEDVKNLSEANRIVSLAHKFLKNECDDYFWRPHDLAVKNLLLDQVEKHMEKM